MKNLFDFATKELSQDAFLRWLFENYDCDDKEVKDASRNLILEFIKDEKYKPSDIKSLWTKAQDHNADISMHIEMNNGDKYGILIEDKTNSGEHNQLKKYKALFDNDGFWKKNTNKMLYVFYKTGRLQQYEKDVIKKEGWLEYNIKMISSFFDKYKNSTNLILNNYANHICEIYEKLDNSNKPIDEDADLFQWEAFFTNVLLPKYKDKYTCWASIARFGYAYIGFKIKGFDFEGAPYLEIRSRDCLNNTFQSKILTYGLDDNNQGFDDNKCKEIRNELKNNIKTTTIFKVNNGEKRNKQVGVSYKVEDVKSNEGFIEQVNKHVEVFEKIIENLTVYPNINK